MNDIMQGVRVLEVAEHTFVPAASALLAEWGAEVIKIEHVERGDAMRGLASSGTVDFGGGVHVLLEHSNRGKKSIALDLKKEEGLELLYRLVDTADIFLTNKLPRVRAALRIDVHDIQGRNPSVIYVRGTGQGDAGPDADKGSYDSLAFWARAGVAAGIGIPENEKPANPPAPAFGDSIGAMTIAGGIMGALYHRERTGEATTVDVSLLGTGLWSMGAAMALSDQIGVGWRGRPRDAPIFNPLTHVYETKDGRFVSLSCLQAAKYWAEACTIVGRPELADDERFADHASLTANAVEAAEVLTECFLERTSDEWSKSLAQFSGQWAMVQDCLEAADDPQVVANNYVQDYTTSDGTPFRLVSPPVHYGGEPPTPKRAPEFNEHADEILEELGIDMDRIIELKIQNVLA